MYGGGYFYCGFQFYCDEQDSLERIKEARPGLFKPFAFHVLIHEYIHSPGYLDEQLVRLMVYEISRAVMGDSHLAKHLAQDITRFIPDLAYPDFDWRPKDFKMERWTDLTGGVCVILTDGGMVVLGAVG